MTGILENLDANSPVTKADYLALSRAASLPGRCPILNRCERHQRTIELIGRECGDPSSKRPLDASAIPIAENISFIGGGSSFLISNCCPEVGLFEKELMFCGLGGYPLTKAQYDKYLDPQYQILETSHFSQCAEFVNNIYYTRLSEQGASKLEPAAAKIAHDLRKHMENIRDETTKAFVVEAIRCFESNLYRSSIVMSWLAAVGALQREVITNHLTDFNAAMSRLDPKWRPAVTTDDLGKLKESDFLDRLVSATMHLTNRR